MPTKARLYIYANICLGTAVLAICLLHSWESTDPRRFLCYLALTMVASTLKVRLPGMTGTISLNFLFVLIALADLSFSETVVVATCGALVQSLWKRKTPPKVVQVAFNTAVLAGSAAFAYRAGRYLLSGLAASYLPVLICLSATLYFFSNTFLVSGVISLIENERLSDVWHRCHLWTFPYYLAGAGVAGVMSVCNRTAGWQAALLILPAVYLVYVFYRQCVLRLAPPT